MYLVSFGPSQVEDTIQLEQQSVPIAGEPKMDRAVSTVHHRRRRGRRRVTSDRFLQGFSEDRLVGWSGV